jgi:hypothetical protein
VLNLCDVNLLKQYNKAITFAFRTYVFA